MKKYLSKKQFNEYLSLIKDIDEKQENLIKCGIDINSKLMSNIMSIQSKNIEFLQKLINDKCETISWFVYQNDYGKKKFEITHNKPKKVFVIDSVDAIYDYLTYHNNNEKVKQHDCVFDN